MRSIRRSLLGYFMLLLALALGAVGLLVDRFANAAIKEREEAEARRIEKAYELRRHEAKVKFDAELINETKALARELQPKLALLLGRGPGGPGGGGQGPGPQPGPGPRPADARPTPMPDPSLHSPERDTAGSIRGSVDAFRLRLTMLEMAPAPWTRATTALAIEPPTVSFRAPGNPRLDTYRLLTPLWTAYDAPRLLTRIQDAIPKLFQDDEHQGLYQFNLVVNYPGHAGRSAVAVHSPKLDKNLPLDVDGLERGSDTEYVLDDVQTSIGPVRRVVKVGGRPWLAFGVQVPPPAAITPPRLLPFRYSDLVLRVVVNHARPYSELESRLREEQANGDAELAHVHEETQRELASLRKNLTLIGVGSFLALVLGGWFIVARGLAPVRKLSDAVSRVSEKDFRLTVEPDEMSRELLPIIARLSHTLDSLRAAFDREKQAVGDISHELRTPIASMLATIDVSLRKPRTSDQYRTTLEDCRAIARQLGQLVERIMTLATLDAGNARHAITRIDAATLASDCAAVIRPLAEAHDLTFRLRTDGRLELDTDADKLREVLMNLLHNAVEYNRPGGAIELTATRDAGRIVLEVRDTGIGMTPEVREKIFERFYRADASRTATGVHAGLGLAIVKEYVERLGGTIAVESEPEKGSRFRVTLPAAPVDSEEPADLSSPDDFALSDRRGLPASAGS